MKQTLSAQSVPAVVARVASKGAGSTNQPEKKSISSPRSHLLDQP